MQYITKDTINSELPDSKSTLLIVDGNALFHSLTEVPETFGDIATKIFQITPKANDFVFSTDMYRANSVKSQERVRRGCSDRYLVKGPSVRKPANWKEFLSNDENKDVLCEILLLVWSDNKFSANIHGRKVRII